MEKQGNKSKIALSPKGEKEMEKQGNKSNFALSSKGEKEMEKQGNKPITRRDFLKVSAVGMGAAALAACAPQTPAPAETEAATRVATVAAPATQAPPTPIGEKAFLRFLTQETDPAEVLVYNAMIGAFETQNPDIHINLLTTGPEQIYQIMAVSFAAGATTIDVLQPNPAMAYMLALKGLVLPINDIVSKVGGESFFYDNSVLKWKGDQFGVPFGGGAAVIWYRKDLFEADGIAVPTTWDEFANVCKHFTKKFNPNSPTEYGACLGYNRHPCTEAFVDPFWWSNGGEMFDKDLNITFDSPETEEVLDYYYSLHEYSPEGATGYAWGDYINTFLTGQVAMSFYLGRMLGRVYSNAPELVGKIGVFDFPKVHLQITEDDPNYYIINANTKYPEQCKKWVEFTLTSKYANDFLCSIPTHLPPATTAQFDWWNQDTTGCKILDENKDIKDFMGNAVAYAYNPITNSGGVIEAIKQGKDTYVATGVPNPFVISVTGNNSFFPLAIQLMAVEGKTARQAIDAVSPQIETAVEQAKKDLGW
jgi:multiple sugar transport system substrate-binding protein